MHASSILGMLHWTSPTVDQIYARRCLLPGCSDDVGDALKFPRGIGRRLSAIFMKRLIRRTEARTFEAVK
jgi:hypothetical protein